MESVNRTLCLWKSNFSIGKSILTLDDPKKDTYPNGPKSIFSILKERSLKTLVLVEDNFFSFYAAYKYCLDNGVHLIYGVTYNFAEVPKDSDNFETCKIVLFIKNKDGYADLIKVNTEHAKKSFLSKEDLEKLMTANLLMAIPFYDSFVHKNTLTFAKFSDFLMRFDPIFFVENNGLPFDPLIRAAVEALVTDKSKIEEAKTVIYYKKEDFKAFLVYKCICNAHYKGRNFSRPNFDNFSSDEFCFEALQ